MTTALYPNRQRDKQRVEGKLGISEQGNPGQTFFTATGIYIAMGYERILYGDHGPYIECIKESVQWDRFTCKRKDIGYYDLYVADDETKLY